MVGVERAFSMFSWILPFGIMKIRLKLKLLRGSQRVEGFALDRGGLLNSALRFSILCDRVTVRELLS